MELSLSDFCGLREIDVMGLFYGYKNIISTGLNPGQASVLESAFKKYGLVFETLDESFDHKRRNYTYIISKKTAYIKAAISAYYAGRYDIVGTLLGYPECCVRRHYKIIRTKGAKNNFVRKCSANSANFFWPINNVLDFDGRLCGKKAGETNLSGIKYMSLIAHNPCSYDCGPSLEIAKRNLVNLRKNTVFPGEGHDYSLLGKPVLYADDFNLAILNGRSGPGRVEYRGTARILGFDGIQEKINEGDQVVVREKTFIISRREKIVFRKKLLKEPLILPFDRGLPV